MAINIADMLTRTRDQVEFPRPVPTGMYYGKIVGLPKYSDPVNVEAEGDKPARTYVRVSVPLELQSPGNGVDVNMLMEAGGLSLKNGQPKPFDYTFFVDIVKNADGSLDFVSHRIWLWADTFLGKGNYRDLREAYDLLVGKPCNVVMEHTLRDKNDPDSKWHRVQAVLPVL